MTKAGSPKRQRLDAAPDETELTKATADRPRNMAPHGQVGLQQNAEIAHRGRGSYQGPTDIQLSGVKVDTPSAGRTPQEVRLLGVKPQSVGTHPFGHPLNTKLHSTPLTIVYTKQMHELIFSGISCVVLQFYKAK